MAIQYINVGTLPNDGEGDPLRTAFQKINNNFATIQQTATDITSAVTLDNTSGQVVFEYPAGEFTQAVLQIQSYRDDNSDSQNASINVSINNDNTSLEFTVYGIMNNGDWLTNYDMDVYGGNVRLLVDPLQNQAITHFISYRITYIGSLGLGSTVTTENNNLLVTEQQSVQITTEN